MHYPAFIFVFVLAPLQLVMASNVANMPPPFSAWDEIRDPALSWPAPLVRSLSCQRFNKPSVNPNTHTHAVCDRIAMNTHTQDMHKTTCQCRSSTPFRFPIKNVEERTSANLIQAATVHVCVYPTASQAEQDTAEKGLFRLRLLSLNGQEAAETLLNVSSTKCSGKRCPAVKGSIFSRRCLWKRLDVTEAMREAASSNQTNLRLIGTISSINNCADKDTPRCFSWYGGRTLLPLRHVPFLTVEYKPFEDHVIAHESAFKRGSGCRSERCKLMRRLQKFDRQEACGVHRIELDIRAYERLAQAHASQVIVHPRAITLDVCAGWCQAGEGNSTSGYVREKFGLTQCLPVEYGPETLVPVTIGVGANHLDQVQGTWRQRNVRRCTCHVPQA